MLLFPSLPRWAEDSGRRQDVPQRADGYGLGVTEQAGVPQTRSEQWWRDAVVYQIYPRSFADADGNGVGDLAGATARLPYVAGLGVQAIWLTPFQRSPQADHGYDVSDYCDVDPLFGDLSSFDTLVRDRARPRPAGAGRPGPEPRLERPPAVPGGAGGRARQPRAGPVPLRARPRPGRRASRRTTGRASSADRPGRGCTSPTGSRESGTCTSTPPSSPTGTGVTPASARCSTTWSGSGSTAAPTGCASTSRTGCSRLPGFPTSTLRATVEPMRLRANPLACNQVEVHEVYRRWRRIADGYEQPRVLVGEANLPPAGRGVVHPAGRAAPGLRVRLPRRAVGRPGLARRRGRAARRQRRQLVPRRRGSSRTMT